MDDDRKYADWMEELTGSRPWWPTVEPTPRGVRVELGGTVVAASDQAMLHIQYGPPPMLPTYYFPPEDVARDLLVDATSQPDGPNVWSVQTESGRAERGAWTHPDPTGPMADLDGMITFDWFGDLEWYEEEERVLAHARDPHKRVDVLRSSRHVEVEINGLSLANTTRPLLLFESMLPTRYYIPPEDVRLDLLTPSDTVSYCPYKGHARYWSVDTGESVHPDLVWSFADPIPENPRIRDLMCFFNEKVEITVDDVPQDRPTTPWSV